jgi:hypothetical protein
MALDIQKLILPFSLLITGAILIFTIYPLESGTEKILYDYELNQDIIQKTTNPLPIFIFIGWTLFVVAYILLDKKEFSKIKRFRDILYDENAKDDLVSHKILLPCKILHYRLIGERPEGKLYEGLLVNKNEKLVYITAIGNENYNNREDKDRFTSPIISASQEMANLQEAKRLIPSLRMTADDQTKMFMRAMKGKSKEEVEYLQDKVEKSLEEEESE